MQEPHVHPALSRPWHIGRHDNRIHLQRCVLAPVVWLRGAADMSAHVCASRTDTKLGLSSDKRALL